MGSTPDGDTGGTERRAVEPAWCAVANVVSSRPFGPGGAERRAGTKHFSPGTKVYVRAVFWGSAGEDVEVVGRHRGTRRLVTMVIRSAWLVNWRVKLVYEPRVLSLLRAGPTQRWTWDGSDASRERADEIARVLGGVVRPLDPGLLTGMGSAAAPGPGLLSALFARLRARLLGPR